MSDAYSDLVRDFASNKDRVRAAEQEIEPILSIANPTHMRDALIAAWIRGFVVGAGTMGVVAKERK